MNRIGLVTVVVRDYDEAIAWYVRALGFTIHEDSLQIDKKRWVVVGPPGDGHALLLLAEAHTAAERSRVGDQTGGRVSFFLQTDEFAAAHERMIKAGVKFTEEPRTERYGTVAVFQDLYGNRWDLLGP